MDFRAKLQRSPLLPFEKQIIELVGCTEDEYRRLAMEAVRRGGPRPAGYEHVPEVRAAFAVPVLVSLVIGVAVSAVSYLLAPKPKALSGSGANGGRVTSRQLDSITGSTRFSPTTGFDSQAELANYGEPIPIIFGRYTGETGGVVAGPKLVWSRMFSYGTQQGVKLLFVVGEQGRDAGQTPQGIDPPDLEGIFIGNGALNAIYRDTFALYWKRNTTVSGFSRVKAVNLLYGTRGSLASGDPETFDDIFSCPTRLGENDLGFSSVHGLSNNAEFGCYAPIANGSAYRVNWRTVSIPHIPDQDDDPGNNLYFERVKICGDQNGTLDISGVRSAGMSGVGRNYSRRMGITALNGVGVPDTTGTDEREVVQGDVIQFTISSAQVPDNYYQNSDTKATVDDINSAMNEERIAADDALQIGELFMIGRTVWQVISRKLPLWRPEDKQDQIIELRCVDVVGLNKIGLICPEMLTAGYMSDDNGAKHRRHAGAAFYPLMRFSLGSVRNNRPCDVTEVGIRSNVYQRLNSVCNFQSLPSPAELVLSEKNRINLSNGTISSYIRRASVFTIYLRPAGLDQSGKPYEWQPLGMRFAVVGNKPIDQYNFIRLKHPESRQYEFRFIPKNGADMRNSPSDQEFWELSASASVSNAASRSILSADFDTAYGRFTVTTVGMSVRKAVLQQNVEFANKPSTVGTITTSSWPSAVGINTYLPDEEGSLTYLTAVSLVDSYTEPVGVFTQGRNGTFTTELFGRADSFTNIPIGGFTSVSARENLPNNQWVQLRYTARKDPLPAGHYSGQSTTWTITEYAVISSSGNWNSGQEFIVSRSISGSNPFRVVPNEGTILVSGIRLRVAGLSITNQAQGRSQAFAEEIFGPARNYDFGTKRQATLAYTAGSKTIRLTLESTVETIPNHWSGLTKFWSAPTITPIRNSTTSTNWAAGDLFSINYTVSASNPFRTPGTSVGAQFIVQGVSRLELSPGAFSADRIFEEQSQYADVSFYGNLVEKSNNSAPEHTIVYVNEMVANPTVPGYDRMTIAGLALKASRNFSNLDQIRFWLPNGVPVTRFHPDDAGTVGPSNLFCDLIFYLLTNATAGLGRVLNMSADNAPLVNTADLVTTAKFLKANRLFFDGALSEAVNLRQFVSDTAPYFLCNFVINDGKFSLLPALPTTATGEISTGPVTIKQLFTSGNILEETFELEYLPAEERKNFQAVVRYRQETRNQLPQERTLMVRWADADDYAPIESFDLTQYCTSRQHAALVAKFFLSIRKRVTHTIRFATTPYGLDLAPGDYIKVVTAASPYSPARNGSISATGEITSATPLTDGQYQILYYKAGAEDIDSGTMTISGGKVAESALWGSLFTVRETTISQNVYMVEQLTLNEDGTVQVTASEFPCDSSLSSLLAQDVTNDGRFAFDA